MSKFNISMSKLEGVVYKRLLTQTLEWFATLIVIIGVAVNATGHHPEGPIIMTLGSLVWVIVGVRWKTASIVITNSVIVMVTALGLSFYYFG